MFGDLFSFAAYELFLGIYDHVPIARGYMYMYVHVEFITALLHMYDCFFIQWNLYTVVMTSTEQPPLYSGHLIVLLMYNGFL